jgi:hypothetical protein
MPLKKTLICILALALTGAFAQTTTGNIVGTLTDPANAVMPNVEVQLTNLATNAVRTTTTTNVGLFRFTQLPPGHYTVVVKAPGFKGYTNKDIDLNSGGNRDLGNIVMALGASAEQVSVTAEATPVQTASSEKAVLVDAQEIQNVAIRGRDEFAMLGFLPGILDGDVTSRDVADSYTTEGITINGNAYMNATLDGQGNMDVGCGTCLTQGNPNMDAVQELRVLTSNYGAEYGRNSGGVITLVTKNGTQEFHGSAWWTHRHEEFNANSWNNNRNGNQRPPYRYNIAGWSLGGPVFVPGLFNKEKKKLFFFASQEFTRQFLSGSMAKSTMPTALERKGDFSQSCNINLGDPCTLIKVIDPTTHAPFPNNIIPPTSVNPLGASFLNFLPLPNYTPIVNGSDYRRSNYIIENTGQHPHDNHVFRADAQLTNKLSSWVRFVRNSDSQTYPIGGSSWNIGAQTHPMPDYALGGNLGYTISPNMFNDFTVGRSSGTWDYWILDPSTVARKLIPNLPKLFPITYSDAQQLYEYLPTFSFGGTPNGAASYGYGSASRYNPVHNDVYNDNLSWVTGKHSFKAGVAVERAWKIQPQGSPMAALGNYGFGTSTQNPLDTGHGFANAFLGNFTSYSEASTNLQCQVVWWDLEWYIQDNWRVSRRLTLDLGLRIYHQTPQADINGNFSGFDMTKYSPAKAPRQYTAGWLNGIPNGTRVAVDPLTGATAPYQALGAFVPGSGDYANGAFAYGKNGVPLNPYSQNWMPYPAPRFGFAYDVFGNGKTAIRGGFGVYYNRLDGNQVYSMTGLPPNEYTTAVYNSNVSALISGAGYISPSGMTFYNGHIPYDSVRNGSIGIQQNIGFGTVLEASGVLNIAHDMPFTYDLNPVPMGANFNAKNANPTYGSAGTTSQTSLPTSMERVFYPGWTGMSFHAFGGHFIYSGLQTTLRRRARSGLQYGVSYTWSHNLGTTGMDALAGVKFPACVGCSYTVNNESRNYGPQGSDRRHNLSVTYSYDVPGLGKRLNSKFLGAFVDNWTFSGITQYISGSPYSPSYSFSPSRDLTGSSSESARYDVVGDAKAIPAQPGVNKMDKIYVNFAAFAIPAGAGASIGNMGNNVSQGLGWVNWDTSLDKAFHLKSERRVLKIRVEAYNVFNHSEISGFSSSQTFNAANVNTNAQAGKPNGTRPARVMAGNFRFEF